ncbi:ANTAR domain-containing response regulator [Sulfitobacter sp. M22]|uniref:ANTAR domain-containing response regulator n=1 Tax=Sulfitobacter sp. M22 TaxID=2675332 RepID=UPI001F446054|nr:ANTAR domain-containing protein [Sulfitobacter sp. M22]MCF7728076.1 ANTAR domain-containing protein [Sulfitobacter sp. M22]
MSSARRKPRISELKGTRVLIFLPPGEEAEVLVTHLIRIGCLPRLEWPIPPRLPDDTDVVIVTVEADAREEVRRLIDKLTDHTPPIIALTGYEDPSTLQLVLELGAVAVIERPIKPFGLLTNLMISRDAWRRRQGDARRIADAESGALSLFSVHVAKLILCHVHQIDRVEAHKHLQKTAMNSRKSIETVAQEMIVEHPGLAVQLGDPDQAGPSQSDG